MRRSVDFDGQQSLWDQIWDQKRGNNWGGQPHNPFAEHVLRQHIDGSKEYRSVLDLGSGDGPDSLLFAQRGLDVTAVDFSRVALDGLGVRSLLLGVESRIATVRSEITDLFLAPELFDVIYSHLGLQFFDNVTTDEIFKKILGWVRRGGLVALKVRSIKDPMYGLGREIDGDVFMLEGQVRHFFTPERLEKLLSTLRVLSISENKGHYPGYDFEQGFVDAIATKELLPETNWLKTREARNFIEKNSWDEKFRIIDVRTAEEYSTGCIENALNLDCKLSDFEQELSLLDREGVYLIYCRTHNRVREVQSIMESLGFKRVYVLEWGITGWASNGFEMSY